MDHRALLVLDLQLDLLPGGAWPLADSGAIPARVADLQPRFALIVATQDWHPPDSCAFAANHPGRALGENVTVAGRTQTLQPVHCVRDTPGAALHDVLRTAPPALVVQRATAADLDGRSAFFDAARRRATGLGDWLRQRGVHDLYVAGLSPDSTLLHTVQDADALGFQVHIVTDACRGPGLGPLPNAETRRLVEFGAKFTDSVALRSAAT